VSTEEAQSVVFRRHNKTKGLERSRFVATSSRACIEERSLGDVAADDDEGDSGEASNLAVPAFRKLDAVQRALDEAMDLADAHGFDKGVVTTLRASLAGTRAGVQSVSKALQPYGSQSAQESTLDERVEAARVEMEHEASALEAEVQSLERDARGIHEQVEELEAVVASRRLELSDASSGDSESLAESVRSRRDQALEEANIVRDALKRAHAALQDARSARASGRSGLTAGRGSEAKRVKGADDPLEALRAEREQLIAETTALSSMVAASTSSIHEDEAKRREEAIARGEVEADAEAAQSAEREAKRLHATRVWYEGRISSVIDAAAAAGSAKAAVLLALREAGGELSSAELAASGGMASSDVTRVLYRLVSARLVRMRREAGGGTYVCAMAM
jgi:hypothetical protein